MLRNTESKVFTQLQCHDLPLPSLSLSPPVSVSDVKVITEDSDKLYTLKESGWADLEAALLYTFGVIGQTIIIFQIV